MRAGEEGGAKRDPVGGRRESDQHQCQRNKGPIPPHSFLCVFVCVCVNASQTLCYHNFSTSLQIHISNRTMIPNTQRSPHPLKVCGLHIKATSVRHHQTLHPDRDTGSVRGRMRNVGPWSGKALRVFMVAARF